MSEPAYPLIWFDGAVHAREDFRIDPEEDALLFGLGLFETTRTHRGVPWLWNEHCRRLLSSADSLGWTIDDALPSIEEVVQFVKSLNADDVVLRLNAGAGAGNRPGPLWMIARPIPPSKPSMSVRMSRYRPSANDPFASHKTFSYGLRLTAHREAVQAGADDALLMDANDLVLEAAHANVFFRFADGWATPKLQGGVLPGTVRRRVLDLNCSSRIAEITIPSEQLRDVQEAFLTNSVRGVVPIHSMDGRSIGIGRDTLGFADALRV